MLKKIFTIFVTSLLIFSCNDTQNTKSDTKKFKIGITQIIAHPALDRAKEGFKDSLKEKNIDVTFSEKNANGEMSSANLIALNFKKEKTDLIYAIATPTAQACSNVTKDIPIVFAAVTDPKESSLTNENITGVSDFVNIKEQLMLLQNLTKEIKSVGFLYNSSEANSKIQLEHFKKACTDLGFKYEVSSVTQVNEVLVAVKYLVNKVDAIYTPTDNLIASVMPVISQEAIKANVVVIGSEKAHVDNGAAITKGIDYYELGRKAGDIAYDILVNGKNPKDIEYVKMNLNDIQINKDTLDKLNINFK